MNPYSITPYAEDVKRTNELVRFTKIHEEKIKREKEDYVRPHILKSVDVISGKEVLKEYPDAIDYINERHIDIEDSYFMRLKYDNRTYTIFLNLYTDRLPDTCVLYDDYLCTRLNYDNHIQIKTGSVEIETPIVIMKKEELI